jgi:hypothetical protein
VSIERWSIRTQSWSQRCKCLSWVDQTGKASVAADIRNCIHICTLRVIAHGHVALNVGSRRHVIAPYAGRTHHQDLALCFALPSATIIWRVNVSVPPEVTSHNSENSSRRRHDRRQDNGQTQRRRKHDMLRADPSNSSVGPMA